MGGARGLESFQGLKKEIPIGSFRFFRRWLAPQMSSISHSSREKVEQLGYITLSNYLSDVYSSDSLIWAPSLSKQLMYLSSSQFLRVYGVKMFQWSRYNDTIGPSDQPGETGTHSVQSSFCSVTNKHEVPLSQRDCTSPFHDNGNLLQGHLCHHLTATPGTYLDGNVHELRNQIVFCN